MIILYHTHFHYRIITSCCLIGTGLHLGDCKIAVIMSMFIRLISCWNTSQNAMLEIANLRFRKSKIFWGGCPQTPLDGSHLLYSTRLSQNPSTDLPPYDVYLLVKPCIYIYIYIADWNFSRSPAKYAPPPSYTSLRDPGGFTTPTVLLVLCSQ
jgi:hypothetical protein